MAALVKLGASALPLRTPEWRPGAPGGADRHTARRRARRTQNEARRTFQSRFIITARTAARRYARALFDVAVREQADLSRIEQDLETFAGLLAAHPSLGKVLLNPAVPAPRKRAAVADIGRAGGISLHAGRLLELLAERDRLVLVPEVLAAYRDRLMDHRQVVRAEITTAVPLAPARAAAIEESLARVTGRSVALTARVDPDVIGGVVARVGSTVYDGSVATQLEKMRQQLTARA